MTPTRILPRRFQNFALAALFLFGPSSWAQQSSSPPSAQPDSVATAVHELQDEVRELRAAVAEIRSESAQYRAETAALRKELETTRSQLAKASEGAPAAYGMRPSQPEEQAPTSAAAQPQPGASLETRVAALEDSTQLLTSKVDEQYQTKVSSASKYRVRLSGVVLMNAFSNRGDTDNLDVPTWAEPRAPSESPGNFGATLRQSELGLEVFGPRIAGARTSGDLQFDFSGGFPNTANGVNYGVARLRIASMRLDWDHNSVVAGQDDLFISPLAPTSFASLAVPALTYSGNLWGWIPQVRVEHRIDLSADQNLTIQGGIFDNLVGEPPYDSFIRSPQGGERSSQPAYGTRVAWTRNLFGQPMTLAAAGYYSRQDWLFHRHVDGWAGMSDFLVPFGSRWQLSGEFYRGRAAGGLGAGFAQSVVFNGNFTDPASRVLGLDSIGGWSQLKLKATAKLEFNGAFGIDSPYAGELRYFLGNQAYLQNGLQRNRSGVVNFIYRPRSDLLFSAEYRRLSTFYSNNSNPTADQVNLSMGILF